MLRIGLVMIVVGLFLMITSFLINFSLEQTARWEQACLNAGGEHATFARDDWACWRNDGTRVFPK